MALRILEFLLGLLLAWGTLRDVFYTVVVPGGTRGSLRISKRLVQAALPVWKHIRGRGIGVNFAPVVLVGSFVTWMLLLVLGFALMAHALSNHFDPPLQGFGHALYVAGASMGTIGFGQVEPHGLARAVTVGGGFCGLAVMTLAVTYLLEVQSNVAHRDTGVLKITTTAGHPPCALTILERYAALGCRDELLDVMREGRTWCATVLQSHASHPWLVYFRSAGTRSGWPAALGALVDLTLAAELLIDDPPLRGPAVLAREEADRLSHDLAELVSASAVPVDTSIEDADRFFTRLAAAGYTLRADRDCAAFAAARNEHMASIHALSHHLGMPNAPLVPGGPTPLS
ncbi:MAG TPA: ion channel [Ramlibacter sp.]|nr:ion channel [Ramlibacter sp.]